MIEFSIPIVVLEPDRDSVWSIRRFSLGYVSGMQRVCPARIHINAWLSRLHAGRSDSLRVPSLTPAGVDGADCSNKQGKECARNKQCNWNE